jgi:hypothetical protein
LYHYIASQFLPYIASHSKTNSTLFEELFASIGEQTDILNCDAIFMIQTDISNCDTIFMIQTVMQYKAKIVIFQSVMHSKIVIFQTVMQYY